MTANEKRAGEVHGWYLREGTPRELESRIASALDAAERRGEERVLRWMRARGWDGAIVDYRAARRARGGKRS